MFLDLVYGGRFGCAIAGDLVGGCLLLDLVLLLWLQCLSGGSWL